MGIAQTNVRSTDVTPPRPAFVAWSERFSEVDAVFAIRHVLLLVYSGLWVLERPRPFHWWEPVVNVLLVACYSLASHLAARSRGAVPSWVPWADLAIGVVWMTSMTTTFDVPLLIWVGTLVLMSQSVSPRTVVAVALAAVPAFAGAMYLADVPVTGVAAADVVAVGRYAVVAVAACLAMMVMVGSRRRVELDAEARVRIDSLTGLASRVGFRESLTEIMSDRNRSAAVLMIDLDNFREINDALGHDVGDQVLNAVADRLRTICPEGAVIARFGSDEFSVAVPDAEREDAVELAGRVSLTLNKTVPLEELQLEIGSSIGIALAPIHATSPESLVQRADVAMHNAKKSSRSYRIYDSTSDTSSVRRLRLSGELRSAIADGQMQLWYQPVIEVATGAIVGAEGLIRWNHPRHGLLSPIEFIELAEISGAIDELTRWVIDRGVRDILALQESGHFLSLSCNLSTRNFHDVGLVKWVQELGSSVGFPVGGLSLEVTESQIMDDPQAAAAIIREFAEMGIGSYIDDFGTGHSSMETLRRLRTTGLKVDRAFVDGLGVDPSADVLVRSVIDLGHNLGMTVVAEGVEDARSLQRLAEFGCDFAQGYHMSPPVPIDQLVAMLDGGAGRTDQGSRQALR